jgi:hypothetical protein
MATVEGRPVLVCSRLMSAASGVGTGVGPVGAGVATVILPVTFKGDGVGVGLYHAYAGRYSHAGTSKFITDAGTGTGVASGAGVGVGTEIFPESGRGVGVDSGTGVDIGSGVGLVVSFSNAGAPGSGFVKGSPLTEPSSWALATITALAATMATRARINILPAVLLVIVPPRICFRQ